MTYQAAADIILFVHTLFVLFVIGGLAAVAAGIVLRKSWARNFWFRLAHLFAIAVVVVQAWLGRLCPLTRWESALRERAGQEGYQGTFVSHWFGKFLYYDFAPWFFVVVYTFFALLVAVIWIWAPPDKPRFLQKQ